MLQVRIELTECTGNMGVRILLGQATILWIRVICICFLLIQMIAVIAVKGGELYSATDTFEKAQDLARRQKDEAADLAIQKAIDDINETLDKKEGNRESGRSSSKRSSRRNSTSSHDGKGLD